VPSAPPAPQPRLLSRPWPRTLILIGAGTGIGPLAGFVRANGRRRPIHLFFGMRHSGSDFLYDAELTEWQRQGLLRQLATACSRGRMPRYVQDVLAEEAAEIVRLVARGARVMVCGGRDMAAGVSAALTVILAPAVSDPGRRAPHSVLALQDAAVATSGDYRHGVTVQGRRLSHRWTR
jgi:sulfite reductase alpha subunit-like flavoprotein